MININGVEYDENTLSADAKALIGKLQFLNGKAQECEVQAEAFRIAAEAGGQQLQGLLPENSVDATEEG